MRTVMDSDEDGTGGLYGEEDGIGMDEDSDRQ